MGSITTLAALVAWLVTQDSQLFQFMMLLPMYSGQIGSSYPQVLIQFFFFHHVGGREMLYAQLQSFISYTARGSIFSLTGSSVYRFI